MPIPMLPPAGCQVRATAVWRENFLPSVGFPDCCTFGYLDGPSADTVLPQCQHLAVGDEIPIGRGGGFPVVAVDPPRALVLSGHADDVTWVWQFGLYPLDGRRTRLVSRNQVQAPKTVGSWVFIRVIEPAAFLMTRRMLLGIKRRAERLAAPSVPLLAGRSLNH